MGSFRFCISNRCQYFITFIDDFSHTFVYLLKNHKQVADMIEKFVLMSENKFFTRVQVFRLDNAKKYI